MHTVYPTDRTVNAPKLFTTIPGEQDWRTRDAP
jgi:hypothetical protein